VTFESYVPGISRHRWERRRLAGKKEIIY
jgi:hypothetical protein